MHRFCLSLLFFSNVVLAQPNATTAAASSEKPVDNDKQNLPIKVSDKEPLLKEQQGPIIELIRAEEGEFLSPQGSKEGVVIFKGGIMIKIGGRTLEAEIVKINAATGEIYGEGGIKLTDGLQTIQGDRFIYDNKNQQGVVYKADTYLKPVYYMGEKIKQVSEKTFLISMAFFTTCEAKPLPHYHFKARKIWMYEDNQLVALGVWYYVGDTRLFPIPALFQTDIGTGIITQYGNNQTRGHFLQNTYFFAVPGYSKNSILPKQGKLMFDWYQKIGEFYGTRFMKESPNLSYDVDMGVARIKERDEVSLPDESVQVTNQVLNADGSCCRVVSEYWFKAKADIRTQWNRSHQYDSQSSAYVRFEQYSHRDFEREFGQRYIPQTTPEALTQAQDFLGGPGTNNLTWQAIYVEDWQNNHLQVEASRSLIWRQEVDDEQSGYIPTYDLSPKVTFSKNIQLLRPKGQTFAGGWMNIDVNGSINRYYSEGTVIKTIFSGDGLSQFNLFFPFYRWLTFTPAVGYGFFHQFAKEADPALQEETARASFQYAYTKDDLRIGYPILYTQIGYSYGVAFDQRFQDPTFGEQREHRVNLSAVSDNNPYSYFAVTTSRDLRRYPYALPENQRWAPLNVTGKVDYDFVHGFSLNYFGLRKKRKHHYWGLGLENRYVYLIRFNTSAVNDLSLYMQLGGYKPLFFRELIRLRVGFTWHHDFIDIRQDVMLFTWEVDTQLHRYWRLTMGAQSRAAEVERYRQDVNFFEDLKRSLNPFNQADRNQAVFNLESFYANIEHDLHRWVARVSYSIVRRTFFFGEGRRDRATFFEQTVFFSMNLRDFAGFGIPRTQVYRNVPSDGLL